MSAALETLLPRLRIRARGLEAYSQILLEAAEEIEALRELLQQTRAERDVLAAEQRRRADSTAPIEAPTKAEEEAALWEERARHLGWRDDREPAR